MKKHLQISSYLLLAITLFFITCKEDKKDDNSLLIGLALLNRGSSGSQTSDINTTVGKASATANLVSTISSSVATNSQSSNFTYNTKNSQSQRLIAMVREIYENGKDPVIAKEAVIKFIKETNIANRNSRELTAWSSSSVNGNGETVYTYSGTVSGYVFTKTTTNLTISGASCPVETYIGYSSTVSSLTKQGTAVFTDGEYKTKTSSGVTTSSNKATAKFTNFGSIYTDSFGYYKYLKDKGTTSFSTTDCASLQSLYKDALVFSKPVTVNGTLVFDNQSSVTSGSSYSFTITSQADSNDLVITQDGTTTPTLKIESLKLIATSTLTSSGSSFKGKFNITITGKINGETLAETITVDFN
ncbi:hypothetical protein LPTSP3_g08750 [Leptospira kobayashii]|uniref:Lipoprotein n=1 Tax=Leptospira kobayashii TaxID=1917830 RepID=A0ABN6KAG7_9LEPT|nr:hypothetical protein [Leptospira kobayashii]BDA77945.1 hypothetical protein LPTSP3_g08750 [Leptospira kobayashii]